MDGRRRGTEVSGDSSAPSEQAYWARIYEQCCEQVQRYFARKVRCSHDREDLVQEVFANLIAHGAHLDPPETYVGAVARNQFYAHWRCQRRACIAAEQMGQGDGQDPSRVEPSCDWDSNPHVQLERSETRQRVAVLLEWLSAANAEVLKLRFFQGLDRHEAAAEAGCSDEAMHKRLTRAKQAFAQFYEGCQSHPNDAPHRAGAPRADQKARRR